MASIDIIACGHKFCWEKKSIHRSLLINAPQAKIFVVGNRIISSIPDLNCMLNMFFVLGIEDSMQR